MLTLFFCFWFVIFINSFCLFDCFFYPKLENNVDIMFCPCHPALIIWDVLMVPCCSVDHQDRNVTSWCVVFQICSVIAAGSLDTLPETVRGLRMVRTHLHAVYSTYLLSQSNAGVSWKITDHFRLWVNSQTSSYVSLKRSSYTWAFTFSDYLKEDSSDLPFQSHNIERGRKINAAELDT